MNYQSLTQMKYQAIKVFKKSFTFLGLEVDKLAPRSNSDLQLVCSLKKFHIDLVVDIGANEGQFANEIRYFGYTGKIVSFEPLATAHRKLLSASKRDPLWEVYERCAVGDYDGEIEMNVSNYSVSSSILQMSQLHLSAEPRSYIVGQEKVKLFKLDSILPTYMENSEHPFLKIDTQGFEWQVLDGCKALLSSFKGIVCEMSLVELYQGQHLWLEVLERLSNSGFSLWAIQPGFTEPSDGRTLQINAVFFRNE
jgi:FkbM family methyltransferase